jgi:hypothetical protein
MKRLIALDTEEFNALNDMAMSASPPIYVPSYQTVSFSSGLHYVFDTEGTQEIEKILILGARAGLVSP